MLQSSDGIHSLDYASRYVRCQSAGDKTTSFIKRRRALACAFLSGPPTRTLLHLSPRRRSARARHRLTPASADAGPAPAFESKNARRFSLGVLRIALSAHQDSNLGPSR